jgi:hypothetical protein
LAQGRHQVIGLRRAVNGALTGVERIEARHGGPNEHAGLGIGTEEARERIAGGKCGA